MDFGVFDHLDRGKAEIHEHYEERLQLIEAYDDAGFHGYHVAEHHFTPLGMAPSPSVFLAAIAQRTKRLRFGPLVYALPLHNPLRLLEEICMVDQLIPILSEADSLVRNSQITRQMIQGGKRRVVCHGDCDCSADGLFEP